VARALETVERDILVIGAGAAGLRAAIAARDAGADVLVLGRRRRDDAHTALAAGGINAALGTRDPEDAWEHHFADTVVEAYMLADARMVELLAREAPAAILELARWGCRFAQTPDGRVDQRYFGAHRYRRTCYAGDYTGREVLRTLADKAGEKRIPVHEGRYVTRLLVEDGECAGAMAFDLATGQRILYLAGATILAAGGYTRIWKRSTSRADENMGEGIRLALEAGCRVADMELVQFHPTGMVRPEENAGTLVSEAARGEGGILLNSLGERFMEKYDPQRMELSTRDRVALAIYTEIIEGRGGPNGGVFLDVSGQGRHTIEEKLPRMMQQFEEFLHVDITSEPMEVAPTAHYSMGGTIVEPETGATDVKRLYAAGEVTSGLHGANRLGGNSLAETVVFGRRAGEAAAAAYRGRSVRGPSESTVRFANDEIDGMTNTPTNDVRRLEALRDVMWEHCGVVRDEKRLREGLKKLRDLRSAARAPGRTTGHSHQAVARGFDLRGALLAAEATMRAALERRESRGAHQRRDYPELDPGLQVNFVVSRDESGALRVWRRAVAPVPEGLSRWVSGAGGYDSYGRLVE
jgi:succinate dehydrogenase / fumarate reductase, flavoprotein subunit